MRAHALLAATAVLTLTSTALAEEAGGYHSPTLSTASAGFAPSGRKILTAENLFGYWKFDRKAEGGGTDSVSSLSILGGGGIGGYPLKAPYLGLHGAIADRVTLGINFLYASVKADGDDTATTFLGIGPRVGYVFGSGDTQFWLRGGVTYNKFGGERKTSMVHLTLDPKIVFGISSHAAFLLGISFDQPLGNSKVDGEDTKTKVTAFGVDAGLLAHF